MAIYHVYSANAEHEVYSRFTCKQCGETTEWDSRKLTASAEIKVTGKYDPVQVKIKVDNEADKKLQALIDDIKKYVEQGFYFEAPFVAESYHFNDKCPFCGTTQRGRKGGLWMVFMYGLLPALLWTTVAMFTNYDLLLIALPIFICGSFFGFILRKKKHEKQGDNINKPEYNWNGR